MQKYKIHMMDLLLTILKVIILFPFHVKAYLRSYNVFYNKSWQKSIIGLQILQILIIVKNKTWKCTKP